MLASCANLFRGADVIPWRDASLCSSLATRHLSLVRALVAAKRRAVASVLKAFGRRGHGEVAQRIRAQDENLRGARRE